jgi:hypothetical protein
MRRRSSPIATPLLAPAATAPSREGQPRRDVCRPADRDLLAHRAAIPILAVARLRCPSRRLTSPSPNSQRRLSLSLSSIVALPHDLLVGLRVSYPSSDHPLCSSGVR